jgi:Ca2+-binding EF-hand superfamily protein
MHILDVDGDGEVSRDEFHRAYRSGVVKKVLESYVDAQQKNGLPPKPADMAHVSDRKYATLFGLFSAADEDGGGDIGADELFSLMQSEPALNMGLDVTEERVEQIMTEIDTE